MKKIILTILTIITILGVNAQGNNLQFNRALFETIFSEIPSNLASSNYTKTASFTVPAGKTWKITDWSATNSTTTNGQSGYMNGGIYISKTGEEEFFRLQPFDYSKTVEIIWLPEGSYDIHIESWNGSSNFTWFIKVSGIEFNIVP